jgi:hypothetical protein
VHEPGGIAKKYGRRRGFRRWLSGPVSRSTTVWMLGLHQPPSKSSPIQFSPDSFANTVPRS